MLVWALIRAGSHRSGKTHPSRVLLTAGAAGVRLRVAGYCLLGWPAPLRDRDHRALEVDAAPAKGHEVARPHTVRRAHPRAIDVHFSAAYRLRGQGAGLEEAHTEEPAVDAGAQETRRPPLTTARQGLKPHQ